MSLHCSSCGYKSNDIKPGGAIPKLGTRTVLTVRSSEDLRREVLKSDTAGVEIPEVELELEQGTLQGIYTTVEGLLKKIRDNIKDANPFGVGDSDVCNHVGKDGEIADEGISVRYKRFLEKLGEMADGNWVSVFCAG